MKTATQHNHAQQQQAQQQSKPQQGHMKTCLGCGARHEFDPETDKPVGGDLPCGH